MAGEQSETEQRREETQAGSVALAGAVAPGTGVMIGAGTFGLAGQIAEPAGPPFPLPFILAAVATAVAACSHVKWSSSASCSSDRPCSLAMFLALVLIYLRLARREERGTQKTIPAAFEEDARRVPAFFPRLGSGSGEPQRPQRGGRI